MNFEFQKVSTYSVDVGSHDRRIDNYLISILKGIPKSHIYRLIRSGQVRVNSKRVKAHSRIKVGDQVRIPPVRVKVNRRQVNVSTAMQTAVNQILYEDDSLLVIDKPAGIAVHSGTRHAIGLIEAMRQLRTELASIELVHRLDKGTSGVLILAKSKLALRAIHASWQQDSKEQAPEKKYLSLLKGNINWGSRYLEFEQQKSKKKGKPAQKKKELSKFSTLQQFGFCSLVEIDLLTGKTHQARRHASHIGHPVAGDYRYGSVQFNKALKKMGLNRMFLHAKSITIEHPYNHTRIQFKSSLPPELEKILNKLEQTELIL